jgi:predicted dienelactone hydrolase
MNSRMSNAFLGITLAACLMLPDLAAAEKTTVNTAANAGDWGKFEVSSAVVHIELTGTVGERRPMDLLLFYPADKQAHKNATTLTVYSSRLKGVTLDPARWDPISWQVVAERAKEGVPVDQGGPSFPLIVMSHAAQGQPINYAATLERLASHGYIIAAPWHEGDTQDDRLIDQINLLAGRKLLQCFDGGLSPCTDGINKAVQNRARDVVAILDNITGYFGDRVDTDRVGFLGQSRGTVTAYSVAGGSTPLNIPREPRVDAIMTLTSGNRAIMFAQDLQKVTIPALLVHGKIDANQVMGVSVEVFDTIASQEKALVILERAEHGAFSIQRCAQMQATGAIAMANPRAIGEQLYFENIILSGNSGTPIDFCLFDSFVNPVDIRPLVKTMTGIDVTPDNVPRDLDTVAAMRLVLELANTFFDATLVKNAQPGVHFKQYMSPKFLFLKEGDPVSYAESWSFQGRPVECDDPDLVSLDPACVE